MNELLAHPDELERGYAIATPAARLRTLRQRLAGGQDGPASARLVLVVGALEALARSLVVHALGRPASTAQMRHRQFRHTAPVELVEEVLRLRGRPCGLQHFGREDWELFEAAARYRDLVVHECTVVWPDRHPYLLAAAEAVLRGMIELAGLEANLRAVTPGPRAAGAHG